VHSVTQIQNLCDFLRLLSRVSAPNVVKLTIVSRIKVWLDFLSLQIKKRALARELLHRKSASSEYFRDLGHENAD